MTLVSGVLEAAYLRSTANDPGKLALDPELILHLNRTYKWLTAIQAAAAPGVWTSATPLSWLGGPPATAVCPNDTIDVKRIESDAGVKVHLITVEEKDRTWHAGVPCCFRAGPALQSRNLAGDPATGDAGVMWALVQPGDLTVVGDAIDPRFPVRDELLLILEMAVYLSSKDQGGERGPDLKALKEERDRAYVVFLKLHGMQESAIETPHVGQNRPFGAPNTIDDGKGD